MPLPINIDDMITGQNIEWERLEFKESWNPISILHSICAFANDINNWGGGYIVIELKQNGSPDPLFQTDEQLTYFLTVLYSHPDFTGQDKDFEEDATVNGTVSGTVNGTVNETQRKILEEIERKSSISYES
jgi:predicted HTH transcriptional regulator